MKETDSFDAWATSWRARFEEVADRALPMRDGPLADLHDAMRYAVLDGGKRVRALFAYAAGEVTRAEASRADKAALAVEYVHAYSLVHDDLPCMDNDLLRRGKPTCHVKYGVAQAMLAGDALQPEAFKQLVSPDLPARTSVALVTELATASGVMGMCGGQMIDLQHVGRTMDIELLRTMHAMKTGALIRAAVRMGAMCGDAETFGAVDADLTVYADRMGLAFQIVDDILDVTADTATLGKTAGKDEATCKPTYVSILGLDKARELAKRCLDDARQALERIERDGRCAPGATRALVWMADYVVGRNY